MKYGWLAMVLSMAFPLLLFGGDGGGEGEGKSRDLLLADDLLGMMEVYAQAQRWAAAIAKGREARRAYLALGKVRDAGRVQSRVCSLCMKAGRLNEARWELDSALALQKSIADHVGVCLSLSLRVELGLLAPDPSQAVPPLLEGFAIAGEHDLRSSFFLLAAAATKVRERLRLIKPAPPSYFDLQDKEVDFKLAMGWGHLAESLFYKRIEILQRDGRLSEAATASRDLVAFNQKRKYKYGIASGWHNLGLILASDESLGEERFERAEDAYRISEQTRKEIGDRANLAWTLNNRGYLNLQQKKYGEARRLFEGALRIFREYFILPGEKLALQNLRKLGKEAGLAQVLKAAEEGLAQLARKKNPEPQKFTFEPKKTNLAYYLFLREDDRLPVVRIDGEKDNLCFTVVSTGEVFRVPVNPAPKLVEIVFKAPTTVFSREPAALAKCVFRVNAGRGVGYGKVSLFVAKGTSVSADREGNLRLIETKASEGPKWEFDTESEKYGSRDTPPQALRTAIEAINRGEWEVFRTSLSGFARTHLNRGSFEATHEKNKGLPVGISIKEGKLRNLVWVEIRYSYRLLLERILDGIADEDEREKKKVQAKEEFEKLYGKNKYMAFLVREGKTWKLDFLCRE